MCVRKKKIQADRQTERVREGESEKEDGRWSLHRGRQRKRENTYKYLFHFMGKKYFFQSCSKNYN